MKNLQDEFFDEPNLGKKTLDDLDVQRSWEKSDDPEDWTYVYARSQSRDAPLYTEGYFKVLHSRQSEPLTDSIDVFSVDEILEKMPSSLKKNYVIPSPSGGYLTVVEVTSTENNDGTISLRTKGRQSTIPVELVYKEVTYDEVIIDLID